MITLDRAKELVLEAVKNAPRGKRNPVVAGGCVNTDEHGNHCIAAQVLVDAGLPVTKPDELANGMGLTGLLSHMGYRNQLTDEAEEWLFEIQRLFDHHKIRTWRQSLKVAKTQGLFDE